MFLLIDNYDSFVYNLYQYLCELGAQVEVVRNDQMTVEEIRKGGYQGLVISPGPCDPDQAGISLPVVKELSGQVPILGVCLGHQSIVQAFGGRIVRAPKPVHGKTSPIEHDEGGLFEGLPNPLEVARYHSLIAEEESLPDCLRVTARALDEDIIMAVAHREHPTVGVQFHPESILTGNGHQLLANFIKLTGGEAK